MTAHYNNATVRKPAARTKPDKPHRDFPLTAHPNGQWCKKIRYKLHYFGPWDDPDAALERYLDTKDDLLAGRTPRNRGGLTVRELVNRFLAVKESACLQLHQQPVTKRPQMGIDADDRGITSVRQFNESLKLASAFAGTGTSTYEMIGHCSEPQESG